MYGIIYKIMNLLDNMIYVGQTIRTLEERFQEHTQAETYIGRAIRKYGAENFTIEVLEECDTREQLNEREIFWIATLNCKAPNGYNLTDGGEGMSGHHCSDETRAKLSAANSGENHPFFGKHLSVEHCAKLSVRRRADTPFKNLLSEMDKRLITYIALGKLLGIKDTAISNKMLGKKNFTASQIAKLVELFDKPAEYLMLRDDGLPAVMIKPRSGANNPLFGKHHTIESRAKMSANRRNESPYKNLLCELDVRKLSYTALGKFLGLTQSTMSHKMRDDQNFTAEQVAKLVEIFDKPAEYLLARD